MLQGGRREVRQGPLGCSCNTPATHSELQNEPRQGCSYTVERDRGVVASAPLSVLRTRMSKRCV